jgi:Glucose dehydrogenase
MVLRTPLPAGGTGAQIEAAATAPEDGQWIRPAKDFASSRFSGLNEINTSNVASLKAAWTFPTGVLRGQEAAPIVVGHMMYVVTPYPNLLYAFISPNRAPRSSGCTIRSPPPARRARRAAMW